MKLEREVPQKESNEEEWERTSAVQTKRDHHGVGRLGLRWLRCFDSEVEEPFSQPPLPVWFPAQALSTLVGQGNCKSSRHICSIYTIYIGHGTGSQKSARKIGPCLFQVWSDVMKNRIDLFWPQRELLRTFLYPNSKSLDFVRRKFMLIRDILTINGT